MTSTPAVVPEILFEVIYDGSGCIAKGPTEVLPGLYKFRFIDTSEYKGELWLLRLKEGKTFQDHLDIQKEPGYWYPKLSWIYYDSKVSTEQQDTNGEKIEIAVWDLTKVAEHTIICYVDTPRQLWFVAPIYVVESLSE